MTTCTECLDLCASRSQIVLPSCPPGSLLAVGEAPGEIEDRVGEGFAGRAGKTLDELLGEHGIGRVQYGRANICRCRPPENRKPTKREVEACLPKLAAFLIETRPKVVLLVGGTATSVFFGTGPLWNQIQQAEDFPFCDFSKAHPVLARAMEPLVREQGGLRAVPMPHTSGLAWNRRAPNGERWSQIGRRQVARAVALVKTN